MTTDTKTPTWRYERGHWWPQSYHGTVIPSKDQYTRYDWYASLTFAPHHVIERGGNIEEAATAMEAAGRMMAAAPDLVAACRALKAWADIATSVDGDTEFADAYHAIVAALTKAGAAA